jgi:uncharacterized protein YcbK (DUF882 family)
LGYRGVSGKPAFLQRCFRQALAAFVALTLLVPPTTVPTFANGGDRTLYLRHTHTGQVGKFTFRKNGQYDQSVLRQLNVFLADWRTKEQKKMDPALFDLLWAVYQDVGATQPINIVSSYRSPKTNAMLAKKSSAVADNSQHMAGKAIDFYIPGVNLTKLREVAMRHQVGGVGYYPTSGSPFVHLDTGNVRAWPRMTRAQLKKVFPDGRTLHLPTDGRPLSDSGRQYAMAEWQKCRTVPCNGAQPISGGVTMLASLEEEAAPMPETRPTRFGVAADGARVQVASLGGDPTQRVVSTFEVTAPLPLTRGAISAVTAEGAPIPVDKSREMRIATLSGTAKGALEAMDEAVGPAWTEQPSDMAVAYAPNNDPEAERALRMIIERETTAALPAGLTTSSATASLSTEIHTASIGGSEDALKGMFDLTFNSLLAREAPTPVANAVLGLAESRQPNPSFDRGDTDLIAPETDHVNETLVMPVFMSAGHFAVLSEAEGYLDKDTELGPFTGRLAFLPDQGIEPTYDRFVPTAAPVLVAAN